MPLTSLTDEELMARYQLGSEEAFALLYQRHSSKVYGFVKKKVKPAEKAAEVFQEVFVKMHKSKHLYNSTLPYLPWLFSISRSVILDSMRIDRRALHVVSDVDLDQLSKDDQPAVGGLSLEPQLAQLQGAQRDALHLRYVDDKTFEEIAVILNTSSVNARKLISRGIAKLKNLVGEGEKP